MEFCEKGSRRRAVLLPLGNVSRRFPFLSQIRHRFRVAIVLFHDGIVAAAAAPPAMSHRLTMLRPRFHFH